MKIRRTIAVIPTFILIAILLYSLYLRSVGGGWINYFVIGITGLSAYVPIAVFIEGIATSFRNMRPFPLRDKIFYSYMILVWIIALVIAIGSMSHNK
ncbi:LasU family protein [Companilactobacillus kimchiensis]|uniref:Integral membrane protein n=1 Tax=Companilactobacillus kimchiensis TaxID=993692 RepID=A0A0R2LGN6_9LACO|nr:LasU family protein [Companilactobacillus kimchiensis]KRN99013.1 hypothetical protein IV57_GL000583 [Companilactobacillus kimchiensis]